MSNNGRAKNFEKMFNEFQESCNTLITSIIELTKENEIEWKKFDKFSEMTDEKMRSSFNDFIEVKRSDGFILMKNLSYYFSLEDDDNTEIIHYDFCFCFKNLENNKKSYVVAIMTNEDWNIVVLSPGDISLPLRLHNAIRFLVCNDDDETDINEINNMLNAINLVNDSLTDD